MKALSQLPPFSKARIFPLLTARPWPNAKSLNRTWDKVGEALPGGRYALDLDASKRGRRDESDALTEFDDLFSEADGYKRYYDLVQSLPNAVPVIRCEGGRLNRLDDQCRYIDNIDRGAVLKLRQGFTINPIADVLEVLGRIQDLVVFIDVGWGRDILQRELWVSGIISAIDAQYEGVEIVVTGSSFPETFSGMGGRKEIRLEERVLFQNLTRRHNAVALTYGDWGSTREPQDPAPMKLVPRLDLPFSREWVSFRQEEEESYSDIAERMRLDVLWPDDLKIWGTYIIEATADGLPGGIKTPAAATAARVNIHLHRQAQFGAIGDVSDIDEPYID